MLFNLFLTIIISLNVIATIIFFTACAISSKEAIVEEKRDEMPKSYTPARSYSGKTGLLSVAIARA